ncbi:hypothetical protein Bca101_062928 [Brassica carinata]
MSSLGTVYYGQRDDKYMGGSYYHDSMVLMNKGIEMEFVRILKIYTALDFSGNKFEGGIPRSIGLLKELHVLNLSNNAFTGHIPSSMGNLTALESLDVSKNQLSGEIPQDLGSLSFLSYMDFSHNKLTGLVPGGTQFQRLNCTSFDDNLGLSGPSLEEICRDIRTPTTPHETPESDEEEEEEEEVLSWIAAVIGVIPDAAAPQLIKEVFYSLPEESERRNPKEPLCLSLSIRIWSIVSGNHVSVTNKSPVSDPPLPRYLGLSGCGITEFPEYARSQNMESLDISNNKIKGQVPCWLWTLPNLYHLNLSNNTFTGFENSTTVLLSRLSSIALFASDNNFTGNIPSFICDLRSVDTLDLSNNNFSGLIPRCLGNLNGSLLYLNLRQNHFHGGLPENIFESLRTLDVGHNQLTGKLPSSLFHFSSLEVLNVESNIFNDTFPVWLSSLPQLKVLVLRSNAFHGPIHQTSFPELQIIDISHNHFNGVLPSDYFVKWSAMSSLGTNDDQPDEKYMGDSYYHDSVVLMNKGLEMELVRILKIYTALDFSGNKLEGEIPRSIGLLKELVVLNLSNNAFTGHIPSSMGNLTALESLDVSKNQLSGEIPQDLGSLSFLSYMDFSHNKLTGLVPGGTQFQRLNCTSFDDNLGLSGPSLEEICRDIRTPTTPHETPESEEEEEEEEEVLSWIAAVIGVIPGMAFGWVLGYILVSYKPEWFMNPFVRNKRRRSSTTTH